MAKPKTYAIRIDQAAYDAIQEYKETQGFGAKKLAEVEMTDNFTASFLIPACVERKRALAKDKAKNDAKRAALAASAPPKERKAKKVPAKKVPAKKAITKKVSTKTAAAAKKTIGRKKAAAKSNGAPKKGTKKDRLAALAKKRAAAASAAEATA